mmetsp:Transcript_115483/g.290606  ORF Transcript_115483/g.290606 Transcript_115483/m.290606 type:complete len:208 (-) Transcript_115483:80-703(-)
MGDLSPELRSLGFGHCCNLRCPRLDLPHCIVLAQRLDSVHQLPLFLRHVCSHLLQLPVVLPQPPAAQHGDQTRGIERRVVGHVRSQDLDSIGGPQRHPALHRPRNSSPAPLSLGHPHQRACWQYLDLLRVQTDAAAHAALEVGAVPALAVPLRRLLREADDGVALRRHRGGRRGRGEHLEAGGEHGQGADTQQRHQQRRRRHHLGRA